MPRSRAPDAAAEAESRLLEAFATRADGVAWDVVDERVVIAVPKRYSAVERFFAKWFPGPDVLFVTLDALGTTAWLAADGSRRVRDVAERLREAFGEDAEPADERAVAFFADLARRRFVTLFEDARPARDEARGFTASAGFVDVTCRRCARAHPIRAPRGGRFACPRCRAVNRVP